MSNINIDVRIVDLPDEEAELLYGEVGFLAACILSKNNDDGRIELKNNILQLMEYSLPTVEAVFISVDTLSHDSLSVIIGGKFTTDDAVDDDRINFECDYFVDCDAENETLHVTSKMLRALRVPYSFLLGPEEAEAPVVTADQILYSPVDSGENQD